jgi:hypothetical protein
MNDFYEWLADIHPSYAPTSPSFMPTDGDVMSANDITVLDIDENDNTYNIPHGYMQDVSPEQPYVDDEPFPIDPTLVTPPIPE